MKVLKMVKWIITEIISFTKAINPVYTGGVTSYQVKQLLKKEGIKASKIEIGDLRYKTIKLADLLKFLRYNASRLKAYQTRRYDCENFAAVLKGQAAMLLPEIPLGEINVKRPSGLHALNFIIMMGAENKPYLMYIEPQTNNVFNSGTAKRIKGYKAYWAHL